MTFLPTIYPAGISRAISSIDEIPVFRELPDGYLRIVVRIIKKIDLRNPKKAIVASRATLAEESGKSVETVHRCIRWLEENGLIERTQKAYSGLRGSSSPLIPTQGFLDALLLSADARAMVEKAKVSKQEDASKTDKQAFQRIKGLAIPADLAWLAREGALPPSGVLKLMKLAKSAKQRLSDIVTATKGYLQALSGKALYCYLRKLVTKGQDFSVRASEQSKQEHEDKRNELLDRKAQELLGRIFKTRDGNVTVKVVEDGFLQETQGGVTTMRKLTERFLDAVAEGRLMFSRA